MKQKLIIMCGIPFSGKTRLANHLSKVLEYKIVNLDDVKFELFGKDVKDSELIKSDWDSVYKTMYERINSLLSEGYTVINDTGNFTKYERELVRSIASKVNIPSICIYLDIKKEVALERLLKNRETKERFDVDESDFYEVCQELEIPNSEENVFIVHESDNLDEVVEKVNCL